MVLRASLLYRQKLCVRHSIHQVLSLRVARKRSTDRRHFHTGIRQPMSRYLPTSHTSTLSADVLAVGGARSARGVLPALLEPCGTKSKKCLPRQGVRSMERYVRRRREGDGCPPRTCGPCGTGGDFDGRPDPWSRLVGPRR